MDNWCKKKNSSRKKLGRRRDLTRSSTGGPRTVGPEERTPTFVSMARYHVPSKKALGLFRGKSGLKSYNQTSAFLSYSR